MQKDMYPTHVFVAPFSSKTDIQFRRRILKKNLSSTPSSYNTEYKKQEDFGNVF